MNTSKYNYAISPTKINADSGTVPKQSYYHIIVRRRTKTPSKPNGTGRVSVLVRRGRLRKPALHHKDDGTTPGCDEPVTVNTAVA